MKQEVKVLSTRLIFRCDKHCWNTQLPIAAQEAGIRLGVKWLMLKLEMIVTFTEMIKWYLGNFSEWMNLNDLFEKFNLDQNDPDLEIP